MTYDANVCPHCGLIHKMLTRKVSVGPDAIKALGGILAEAGFSGSGSAVFDSNTRQAAGRTCLDILTRSGFKVSEILLQGNPVHADSARLDELSRAVQVESPCWLLAVGSGSINDLVKVCAHRANIPYAVAATAASMDGYLSANAAVMQDGIKKQFLGLAPPLAVIADTDVLRNAPPAMSAAGLGDALGKLTSIPEWRINNMLTGERFCSHIAEFTDSSVSGLLQCAGECRRGSETFFNALIRTLLDTGAAMQMMNNSAPASCGEHYYSHALDTYSCAVSGDVCAAHGAQVAVGAIRLIRMYSKLPPSFVPNAKRERYLRHIKDWQDAGVDVSAVIHDKLGILGSITSPKSVFASEQFRCIAERFASLKDTVERVYEKFGVPDCAAAAGIPDGYDAFAWEHAVDMRKRFSLLDFT